MTGDSAVVVFVGRSELPWLRLLRAGFRHCFVCVRQGEQWIVLDPLAQQTTLAAYPRALVPDPAAHYRALGLTVLEVPLHAAPRRQAPVMPFTCVEAVKRVLGLHSRRIVTPWQLYRHLCGRQTGADKVKE